MNYYLRQTECACLTNVARLSKKRNTCVARVKRVQSVKVGKEAFFDYEIQKTYNELDLRQDKKKDVVFSEKYS